MTFSWLDYYMDDFNGNEEGTPDVRINMRLQWWMINPWAVDNFALTVHENHREYFASLLTTRPVPTDPGGADDASASEENAANRPSDSASELTAAASSNLEAEEVAVAPGWKVYDHAREMRRLATADPGVPSAWRATTANADYQVSPTYPRRLVVPSSISDTVVQDSSKFRSKGRIPSLVWRHKTSSAVMCRCAQPLAGVGGKRSAGDEQLVAAIADAQGPSWTTIPNGLALTGPTGSNMDTHTLPSAPHAPPPTHPPTHLNMQTSRYRL